MNVNGIAGENLSYLSMRSNEIHSNAQDVITDVAEILLLASLTIIFSVITFGCTVAFFIGCLYGVFSVYGLVASILNLLISVGFSRKTIGKAFLPKRRMQLERSQA